MKLFLALINNASKLQYSELLKASISLSRSTIKRKAGV